MKTYGDWLNELSEILGQKLPMNGTAVLASYFRRGFSPAATANVYVPIVEKTGKAAE